MWKKPERSKSSKSSTRENLSEEISNEQKTPSDVKGVRAQHEIPKAAQSTIGKSAQLKGDIRTKENLLIEGEIEGHVYVDGHMLRVGRNGRLTANLFAKIVHIEGVLIGDAYGAERVIIHKTGRVEGNIVAPRVIVEDGANVRGKIDMDPDTIEKHFPKHASGVGVRADGVDAIVTPILKEAKSLSSSIAEETKNRSDEATVSLTKKSSTLS